MYTNNGIWLCFFQWDHILASQFAFITWVAPSGNSSRAVLMKQSTSPNINHLTQSTSFNINMAHLCSPEDHSVRLFNHKHTFTYDTGDFAMHPGRYRRNHHGIYSRIEPYCMSKRTKTKRVKQHTSHFNLQ